MSEIIEAVPGQNIEAAEALLEQARSEIEAKNAEAQLLMEGMRDLQLALEVKGWKLLSGGNNREFDGLDLDLLKELSDEIRANFTGGALAKRLIELRTNYVLGAGGVEYTNSRGAGTAVEDPRNVKTLFGPDGLSELIRAEGTDGNIVILVNKKTKRIKRLPISRVESLYLNPDDPEDIWFVKEKYTRLTTESPQGEEVELWYRCDLNEEPGAKTRKFIKEGARRVKIDPDWIAVFDSVNGQVGHTLGTPDLLASLPWLHKYGEYLNAQLDFAKALAAIAVQIKSKGTKAQEQAKSALRGGGQAGIANTGEDTEIVAQRGASDVSFDNGRALAAMAATGAEVSVIHALSDPGAAGSSYGSAQTLDLPTSRAVQARREHVASILKRVLTVMGATKPSVRFAQIADEQTHRLIQAISVMWSTGMFNPEELRVKMAELVDIAITGKGPSDVLIPNTKSALKAAEDAKPEPAAGGFAPNGQGRDNLRIGKTDDQSNGNRPERDDEQ